jgi:phosphotransferase system enzyme I (PtsI)
MKIHGVAASEGIAIAKAFVLEEIKLDYAKKTIEDPSKELERLNKAMDESEEELKIIRKKTKEALDEEHAMIFDAHIQILRDPEIASQVKAMVENEQVNAVYALHQVTETFANIFASMDDDYMKERAADVRDVRTRVASHLLGVDMADPTLIDEEVVVIAHDLTPSDTAQLNKEFVLGFVTNIGGRTSHSAIMARSLEIPAVLGTKNVLDKVDNGDQVIIDGIHGDIIVNPTDQEVKEYEVMKRNYAEVKKRLLAFKDQETLTKDKRHVELAANIGTVEDVKGVLNNGAEGIGLYRTEFLYMNSEDFPTEEEQFLAYKEVLEQMGDSKVVIRTLDIGGDKELSYLDLPKEMNPFLGHRALRLCLEETELFKTQLRALLRASVYGNLHIMFPMVATIPELRDAKVLLEEVKQELEKEKIKVGDYKVGIMVEIPAVAMLADQFAKEVDFFSIGTNDLIQYTFAADRMNEKVSYLYQPYNPSLLRLIKNVIDASHEAGIWTGMCGEMAGDQTASLILLGLGLDEFSMSPTSILRIRELFGKVSYEEMQDLANKVVDFATDEEVRIYVNKVIEGLEK